MNGTNVMKRMLLLIVLAVLLTAAAGCSRVRTTPGLPAESAGQEQSGETDGKEAQPENGTADSADGDPDVSDSGGAARENPEADRKEYDETADAEIIAGAARTAAGDGTGDAASRDTEESDRRESMLGEEAEKSATRVVAAGEAARMGVAEDAKIAETAMDYYRVLLEERTGSLMECQRLYVYWESEEEWRTVYRTSPGHRIILDSGCYDVSSRLTEERLQVDAGWVVRKDPDVIVRVVPKSVLGSGVFATDAAAILRDGMLRREGWDGIRAVQAGRVILISAEMTEAPHLTLTAELLIAKAAYPELMQDVDVREAMKIMTEEATGTITEASFFYDGRE